MKILFFFFIILSLILGVIGRFRNVAGIKDKNRVRPLLIGGMVLSGFSIMALLASYFISGRETDLFKLALPGLLLIMFITHYKQTGRV
ncbi:MAG: hypothetical protein IPO92_10175 [Saprospiraceae bacterium]|nr:hypothetical protein [Saprospiraceae bacterium]